MKRLTDLTSFKNILPYASEIFGVYQPLFGWKSKRAEERFHAGFVNDMRAILSRLKMQFEGHYKVQVDPHDTAVHIVDVDLGRPLPTVKSFSSVVLNAIAAQLPALEKYHESVWGPLLEPQSLKKILNTTVQEEAMKAFQESRETPTRAMKVNRSPVLASQMLEARLSEESAIAGTLHYIHTQGLHDHLKDLFYTSGAVTTALTAALKFKDPFETFDPKKEIDRVGLSPIGIVHLFRQYFFEFDTFLGTPVGHVWLSPGSTVELIEISTRRTLEEKTVEITTETTVKAEQSTTEQDELSDAVKEDNRTDIKFGANVSAHESWIWGSADQSASFGLETTQQTAREQSHKKMRQQTEKLSTEIRKNYRSTFKTVTEQTVTSSKRYLLTNATEELVNYELRRKMRQVAVQVQDIGTYLCWQTYVDEPGKQLGIGNLLHIAKPPELDSLPHPEAIVPPKLLVQPFTLSIPFVQTSEDAGDLDEGYASGVEEDTDFNEGDVETIESNFPQTVVCDQIGYRLVKVEYDVGGADIKLSTQNIKQAPDSTTATFTVHVDHVNFRGQSPAVVAAKLKWEPNQDIIDEVAAKNKANVDQFTAKVEQEYRKAYISAAKERIKFASQLQPRSYEDLREEERIVVYRVLIQSMLYNGVIKTSTDDRTRHVVAEVINSIFDVDKMLYFVSAEYWKPRVHHGQTFGTLKPSGKVDAQGNPVMVADTATILSSENITGWGGLDEQRADNYYVTEESAPAKLGSSLGWLLQLDGDNLRNAFLNAPWVRAVIPIRPGKERAALNWLQQVEGMNGIGPGDLYTGSEAGLAGKTMIEVLEILADKVRAKHQESIKTSDFPDPDHPTDPESTVTATPVDKVYEHGFYPLSGGFKANVGEFFEVFDQWIEVLPTDQVVAVEVKYDPKTGRQL